MEKITIDYEQILASFWDRVLKNEQEKPKGRDGCHSMAQHLKYVHKEFGMIELICSITGKNWEEVCSDVSDYRNKMKGE